VLDRGPGINPDELQRIFEKFYRGRRGRDKVEGTGMGLAIAKGIIEAHGGKIRAENRPGGGAGIVMTLPLPPGADQTETHT
jgi:two-component system, OmpR family, sensor histidine kinase KdpD